MKYRIIPNRSLDRLTVCLTVFLRLSKPFLLPPASCLPLCLDVARYAFGKGDSQSARRQNEIALDSNDRFGIIPNTVALLRWLLLLLAVVLLSACASVLCNPASRTETITIRLN